MKFLVQIGIILPIILPAGDLIVNFSAQFLKLVHFLRRRPLRRQPSHAGFDENHGLKSAPQGFVIQAVLFVIDTPFVTKAGEPPEHAVNYVLDQFREMIAGLERLAGRQFQPGALEKTLSLSQEAVGLWREIRNLCRTRPPPLNIPDMFLHLAPIVVMRGTKEAVGYYRRLLAEVQERVRRGQAAVAGEKHRLLWDNIAIWYRLFGFFKMFSERGACFVVDTYAGGWTVEILPGDPLESLARTYTGIFLNQGINYRAQNMVKLIKEFGVDGFVMHPTAPANHTRWCKRKSAGR